MPNKNKNKKGTTTRKMDSPRIKSRKSRNVTMGNTMADMLTRRGTGTGTRVVYASRSSASLDARRAMARVARANG